MQRDCFCSQVAQVTGERSKFQSKVYQNMLPLSYPFVFKGDSRFIVLKALSLRLLTSNIPLGRSLLS